MSEPSADESADETRIDRRATLLPEEQDAGSDDPHAQAEAILAESDERTNAPEETRHESTQTPDDPQATPGHQAEAAAETD
ncbi:MULTISPECIES: hypothetical protein [unclassified Nocardioides]|uniref:hypothetical protein n=1 Tax=unclassified Nocardioides TaxID=2615069 RepID=UPI001E3E5A74|nr:MULTISPECIES: hypothetical protein [unclassified Nocardioides]MCD4526814.1 hypothetical protein [Nocardioides sp. cx-173]MCD4535400.1 hypothetical protein [Nocardioides sp. cx-169]UGB43916.1 hypothetical protein LQ940_10460 [Nocardioides sp. cx-173]